MITLKTLHKATAQEVFDQVARHLLKQNEKCIIVSSNGDESCRYRHGDKKCAAGCFISEDEYKAEFETHRWKRLVEWGYVTSEHDDLICRLQDIHDFFSVYMWDAQLKNLAEEKNLSYDLEALKK